MPKANVAKNTRNLRVLRPILTLTVALLLLPLCTAPAKADGIIGAAPAGSTRNGVAVDETNNKVYVVGGDEYHYPEAVPGTLTVVDGATGNVSATLDIGGTPRGVALDETDHKIYVANLTDNVLTVINGADNTVLTPVPVSDRPTAVAWDPATNRIYTVHNTSPGRVTVVNASTGTVMSTLSIDEYPTAVAVNSTTNRIYATHQSGKVTVIDGSNYSAQSLNAGVLPQGVAVNAVTNRIYVVNSSSNTVSVIDGSSNTVTATIAVGRDPWGVAVNEDTNRIYAANQAGQSVTVIDGSANTVVQTIDVPGHGNAFAVGVDQTRNKIYAAARNIGNNLIIIDGSIIEAAGVTGLEIPQSGEVPQTSAALTASNGRYAVSGLIWENIDGSGATLTDGKFANPASLYQARIELTAQGSYKFPTAGLTPTVADGTPGAGTVGGGDATGNTLTFVVTFTADITEVSIEGMTPPSAGETPEAYTGLTPADPAQYAVTSLTWEDTGGNPAALDPDGMFPYGGAFFRARIVLTSQPGYKFPVGSLTPMVDGDGSAAQGTVSGGDVSGNTLTFLVTFSEDVYGYQAYITGLDAPTPGGTPKTAGDLTTYESGQYCYATDIIWENSDGSPATLVNGKFSSGGSTYKALIELVSQPGHKFRSGDLGLSLEGDGKAAPGTVSGGYISGNKYTFEVTFSDDVTSVNVTGLVAPANGAVPVTDDDLACGNPAQYDVDDLTWLDVDGNEVTFTNGKFSGGTVYKAVIYLETNEGYKFPPSGVSASVNAGTLLSVMVSNRYESGNMLALEAVFPATAPDFHAVTGITGVPTAATAGVPLPLTGTVAPSDATNKTIVWGVKAMGGTGARISGNTLSTTAEGTVVVTATIIHGLTESSNFIKDFTIAVHNATYTMTFNSQGGSTVASKTVNYNTVIPAPTAPARTGYTFAGWYRESACTNAWNFSTKITGNVTLYAKWTINSYTVTFNSQGGSSVSIKKANYNTAITAPAAPTRTGYTFAGWYRESACTNAWSFSTRITGNVTLYAKWTANRYAIAVSANSTTYGAVSGGGNYAYGSAVTVKATPKAGYRFVRWLEGAITVSTSAEYRFTVAKTRTFKAEFAKIGTPGSIKAASAGYNSVKLTWAAVTGAREYEVYRAKSSVGSYTRVATTAALTCTNGGLATNTTYYYKVRAKCVAGSTTTYGSYSSFAQARPVPATPGSVKAARASARSIKLTWGAVAGVTKYEIYRATSSSGTYKKLGETTAASYTNTGLTTGKTYYYKVRAYRLVGSTKVYGGYSAAVTAKP